MEESIALYFWSLKGTFIYDLSIFLSTKVYILISSMFFIIYACIKLKRGFIPFIIALIISVSLSDLICYRVLKPAIGRMRPKIELNISDKKIPPETRNYSMPSNHASNIFAFFIVYLLLVKKFWFLSLLNSLAIAFSRVAIVKHYPTDVLAGIAVGTVIGLILVFLINHVQKKIC